MVWVAPTHLLMNPAGVLAVFDRQPRLAALGRLCGLAPSGPYPRPCFTRRRGVPGEMRSPGVVSLRALTCIPTRVGVWCAVLPRVWGQGGGEGGDGVGDRLRITAGQAVPAVGDEL